MSLSKTELERYQRNIRLAEVGVEGQEKIKSSRVLIIGAGGLGSPIAMYLAAGGVGTIGIMDFDKVDLTNLQRQIVHGTHDVGKYKTDSAKDTLHEMNPEIKVETYREGLNAAKIMGILKNYDIAVGATDNFETRYLLNDACVLSKKPFVHGAIFRFEGQVSVFCPGNGPCFRCLFEEAPPKDLVPKASESGVLGVLPGVVGTIQATETMKLILGKGELLIGTLLLIDTLKMEFRKVRFPRNPLCPVCGDNPQITSLV